MNQCEREDLVMAGAVGIAETERLTGLGRTNLYSLMGSGELKYIKIGKRRLVPRTEITRLLADHLVGIAGRANTTEV